MGRRLKNELSTNSMPVWLTTIAAAIAKIFASFFGRKELEEKNVIIHKTDDAYETINKLNDEIIVAANVPDPVLVEQLKTRRRAELARLAALRSPGRNEG